jgi:glycosyltransferase involved in cell wall biosynthesis
MPYKVEKISIVIPVYNEELFVEENTKKIIENLSSKTNFKWEILLVENGSTDKTLERVKALAQEFSNVTYLALREANYGNALKEGLLSADGDVIVNFDIDYWDTEFVEIVAHVMKVRYDIVIASKNLLLSKDKRGLIRKIASYSFRMILFFVFGLRVSDTHGIKAWRNSEKIKNYFKLSKPNHHTFDTEVIIRAMHEDCQVLEIPVEVIESRETDRNILKRVPKALTEILEIFYRLKISTSEGNKND